jgi:hypothetical protein
MFRAVKICLAVTLLQLLAVVGVNADEGEWQHMGISDNGMFVLSVDQKSVKKIGDVEAYIKVKRELSEEGQKIFKKKFYEEKIRAEKEAGEKMDGDPEELLRLLSKNETAETLYLYECKEETYRVQTLQQYSSLNVVRVYTVQKGSTEEKIKKIICSSGEGAAAKQTP